MRATTRVSAAAMLGAGSAALAAPGGLDRVSAMGLAKCPASFADFLAPVTVEQFRRDYLDRAPLHIPGAADKFADVMSWDGLNRLLDMTAIWSSRSLNVALDSRVVPAEQYCRPGWTRAGRTVLVPDAGKVQGLLRHGASLVLNDIDTLTPALRALSDFIQTALGARVQINLYCSWRERQAFPSHFDTHDVLAVHIAGEKRWNIYRGRADQPVDHPTWKALGQPHHEQAKGAALMSVDLRPVDVLYLPRGQYHDALATGDTAIHLSIGVNEPIGLDVVTLLFEDAVAGDATFRRRLPGADDARAVDRHLETLAARAGARLVDPVLREKLAALRVTQRDHRGGFSAGAGFRAESGAPPAAAESHSAPTSIAR
jgi:ribosomal protein L16 Arg81 hydroxylase